jgi:hypothetical protein
VRILFLTTSESKSIRTGDSEGRLGSYSRHSVNLHVIQNLQICPTSTHELSRLYRVERGSAGKRRRERERQPRERAHARSRATGSDRQRARASPPMSSAQVFERARTRFLNVCVVDLDALTILKQYVCAQANTWRRVRQRRHAQKVRAMFLKGTRSAHAWVVRWVVGAVSVNRRRASGGYRHALSASRASLISH